MTKCLAPRELLKATTEQNAAVARNTRGRKREGKGGGGATRCLADGLACTVCGFRGNKPPRSSGRGRGVLYRSSLPVRLGVVVYLGGVTIGFSC